MVKTIWKEATIHSEVERILFISGLIAVRFYEIKDFVILPKPTTQVFRHVYLPALPVFTDPHYWYDIRNNPKALVSLPSIEKQLQSRLEQELFEYLSKKASISGIQTEWSSIEPYFWNVLADLEVLPASIDTLTIQMTRFGTRSSAYLTEQSYQLMIFLREDATVHDIAIAVLLFIFCLTKKNDFDEIENWEERQAIIDFLLCETKLHKIFPDFRATLPQMRNTIPDNIRDLSNMFLKHMGFVSEKFMSISDNQTIHINKKPVVFSSQEFNVLKALIENPNKIVTFESLGKILWKNETEKFSLAALAKIIERIRKRCSENNISPDIIETRRGNGYILHDVYSH